MILGRSRIGGRRRAAACAVHHPPSEAPLAWEGSGERSDAQSIHGHDGDGERANHGLRNDGQACSRATPARCALCTHRDDLDDRGARSPARCDARPRRHARTSPCRGRSPFSRDARDARADAEAHPRARPRGRRSSGRRGRHRCRLHEDRAGSITGTREGSPRRQRHHPERNNERDRGEDERKTAAVDLTNPRRRPAILGARWARGRYSAEALANARKDAKVCLLTVRSPIRRRRSLRF